MKKLSLLVMAAISVACDFGNPKEMKEVVIAGKVINLSEQSSKVIKVNFCNPVISGGLSAALDEKNEFVVRQDMMYIQNMTVNYRNYFINLYVQPGDSVHLTIDASMIDSGNFEWLTINGDHASISRQLNLTVNYLYRLPVHSNNLSLPPDAMLASVKMDYERYLLALNDFAKANRIDPFVVNWAKKDLKYLVSNSIVDYGSIKEGSAADKLARTKIFTDPFFDMYNADTFQSMLYPYHLMNYTSFLQNIDNTISADLKENRLVEAMRKKIAITLNEPPGESRDYMLYHQLSSLAKIYPGILDSLKDVDTYFTKTVYKDYLRKFAGLTKPVFAVTTINGISYLKDNGEADIIPETDVFSYLKTKYPGKVLYIDVYATWCAPCLKEMESAPALYQAMEGKDVVFINLCLQSTPANWKKLINIKNIKGENYFFSDEATKLFMGTYKLLGFPSYILVDKQGQIVTTNAPRPSQLSALKGFITKLLDEK